MAFTMTVGGVVLPAPVKLSSSDELIWSASTGRSANGAMIGSVIANKTTFDVEWGVLTETQTKTIINGMNGNFFTLTIRENGTVESIQVYRGTIKKEHMGYIGDGTYYRSVSVSLIQK